MVLILSMVIFVSLLLSERRSMASISVSFPDDSTDACRRRTCNPALPSLDDLNSDMVICLTGDAHLLATEAGTDCVRVPGLVLELDGAGEGLLSRFITSGAGD